MRRFSEPKYRLGDQISQDIDRYSISNKVYYKAVRLVLARDDRGARGAVMLSCGAHEVKILADMSNDRLYDNCVMFKRETQYTGAGRTRVGSGARWV